MEPQEPRPTVPDDNFAVIVNANAGRVTPRVARSLQALVPADKLHLTRSPEQADAVLRSLAATRVGTVFAGGGDGTIVGIINGLVRHATEEGADLPRIGVLSMGTGNALARWLGCGPPLDDLQAWLRREPHGTVPMSMIETEGSRFPFGGLGQDAAVLNDYNHLKSRYGGRPWWRFFKGVPGYFAAALLRTVPTWLGRPAPVVTITNLGQSAHRIGPDGAPVGPPLPTGATLYRGPCSMVGVGTTPLYGYGLRIFPHATRLPGRCQLRVINLGPIEALLQLKACWEGTLVHPRVHDLYVERVRVVFDTAMPWQLGGEAQGYRRELTLAVTRAPVQMLTRRRTAPPTD